MFVHHACVNKCTYVILLRPPRLHFLIGRDRTLPTFFRDSFLKINIIFKWEMLERKVYNTSFFYVITHGLQGPFKVYHSRSTPYDFANLPSITCLKVHFWVTGRNEEPVVHAHWAAERCPLWRLPSRYPTTGFIQTFDDKIRFSRRSNTWFSRVYVHAHFPWHTIKGAWYYFYAVAV